MNRIPLINTEEPKWLSTLRSQCASKSQRIIADELGVSTAMISQVLKGSYTGNMQRIEQLVRGAYLGDTVGCPVLGELQLNRCLKYQRQKISLHNPMRVALYKACNGTCINSEKNREQCA